MDDAGEGAQGDGPPRSQQRRAYESSFLDAHPAGEIAALPAELAAKFAASDFTDEQIAKVLAVRPDQDMMHSWLDNGWPPPAEVETWAEQNAKLLESTLIPRTATWADNDMLTDLCANAPETVDDWSVTVERGPNPYAAYRLQEHPNVLVLEDRRVALGMSAASGRNTYIQGVRTSVNCMSGWRIRDGFRGMGLSNMIRSAAGPGTSFFGLVTYYYLRLRNSSAAWIAHIETDMEDRPDDFSMETDQLTASLSVFDSNPVSAPPSAELVIREATEADLPRCVDLINRTHDGLDLFRPYTLDFIGYRLNDPHWGPKPAFSPPVYGWSDYRVVEAGGNIVACGGMWDRGRDIREVWRRGDEQFIVDPTALMDFGFEAGGESAMAALIEHFVAKTSELGRSGLMAGLEFLPELRQATSHLDSWLDTRGLHVLPFRMPGLELDLTVRRPYTDIAYW